MAQNSTRIHQPLDEQDFERACVVLFRGLLKDPNTERIGRRGQDQDGVDIYGLRNEDPARPVGIQCKAKGPGKKLTEAEVRREVNLAIGFEPKLSEYFIVTTAPDDAAMQRLARVITAEQTANGQPLRVTIWGWGNLEERIALDPDAVNAFDPGHTTHSAMLQADTLAIRTGLEDGLKSQVAALARIESMVALIAPGGDTVHASALDAAFDGQIDALRNMANGGKPAAAYELLASMLKSVPEHVSGRILFRIKANMGSCLHDMGEVERAGSLLLEAAGHAPEEPKAAANRAFGLLLLGRYEELACFGEAELASSPLNASLAGYVIQGLRAAGTKVDPLASIPEGLHDSEDVVVAMVDFRRSHDIDNWATAAEEALGRFPQSPILRRFHAEAVMERIVNSTQYQRTLLLTEAQRLELHAAAEVLEELWHERLGMDIPVRSAEGALCANLIVCHHALGDYSSAVERTREGLKALPDDQDIIIRGMLVALDADDEALADLLYPKLGEDVQATIFKLRYHHGRGDWAAIAAMDGLAMELVPAVERTLFRTMVTLAKLRLGIDDAPSVLKALVEDTKADPRSSIATADFARGAGFVEEAALAYGNAKASIDASSHIAARVTVAMHAARTDRWPDVVELLLGYVDTTVDGLELRLLTSALVNDTPVKRRTVRFFASLGEGVRKSPHYLHAAGLMHFNRGALEEAADCLRAATEIAPLPETYTALFATLRRAGREAEIRPLLDSMIPQELSGNPVDLMRLAHELLGANRGAEAVSLAYRTVIDNRNDAKVAMLYFGLLIGNGREAEIPVAGEVAVDSWFRLEDSEGKSVEFVVTTDVNKPADGVISTSHPLAVAAFGKGVGAEIEVDGSFGVGRKYRIAELKHKYLHALHDIMTNFETRFPHQRGFQSFTMKDDDLSPFLDQVKRLSEEHDRMLDLHTVQGVPLSMIAAFSHDSVVRLADHVRRLGNDLRTCTGHPGERVRARRLIADRRSFGVVLDTFALWTAVTMDCLSLVKAVFGKVVVARSTLDDLVELRERDFGNGEMMTVGWRDGEHFRTVISAEEMADRRRYFDQRIAEIEKHCVVVPAEAPDELGDIAKKLLEAFGSHVLDPCFATDEGMLLISEDRHYRDYCRAAMAVDGVWLQAVSEFARDTGLIDAESHARNTISLAHRQHGYLTFDAMTMRVAIGSGEREAVAALCRYLGDESAHMPSHLKLVAGVMGWLWGFEHAPAEHRPWATGMLLDALVRHRPEGWSIVVAWLKEFAPADLSDYLDRWTIGHFLDPELVQARLREIRARQAQARIAALHMRTPHALNTRAWPGKGV